MRNLALLTVFIIAAVITACAGVDGGGLSKSTVAVLGDLPYGANPTDVAQFQANPAFINSINLDPDVSLVLHVGDIHSGKQYCTEAYNRAIYDQWTAYKQPLVYTPGDNEWSDCHKPAQGGGTYDKATQTIKYITDASGKQVDYAGGNPVANLSLVRSIFFATPGKAFGGSMDVHTQAKEYDTAHPSDRNYVENVWWKKSGVLFVAVNIPGGSNNDTDPWYGAASMSAEQAQEVAERTGATLRWLDAAFKRAQRDGALALVIETQADMWDIDGATPSHLSQHKQFLDLIAPNATAFGKPVLMFNGDSHVYRSDNPLVRGAPCVIETGPAVDTAACTESNMPSGSKNPGDPYMTQPHGYNVPNFHRIVVHGSTFPLEWLKFTINPDVTASSSADAFGPFSWQRMQHKQ